MNENTDDEKNNDDGKTSSAHSTWDGTHKRAAVFKKIYDWWKKLNADNREDIPLLTLLTSQNARGIREDILPQLQKTLELERLGIDPFHLFDCPPESIPDTGTFEIPDKVPEKKDTWELSKPPVPTKTLRLGSHKKQVPVKQEPVPEEVPEDPADPVPEPSMAYLQHEAEQHQEDPVPEPEPEPDLTKNLPSKYTPAPSKYELYEQPVPIQKRSFVPTWLEEKIQGALLRQKGLPFTDGQIYNMSVKTVNKYHPAVIDETTPEFKKYIEEARVLIREEIARQEAETYKK